MFEGLRNPWVAHPCKKTIDLRNIMRLTHHVGPWTMTHPFNARSHIVKKLAGAAQGSAFLGLHKAGRGFVMPNAWDAGSAVILANEGFEAIGTTSAGIASSL